MFDVPDGVGEVTEGVEDHRVHQHCHLRPVTRVNVVLYQILEREYLHITLFFNHTISIYCR